MDSIIQKERRCYLCHRESSLHKHHIYFGRGNRTISEKNGFTVFLCAEHHNLGNVCVHNNRELDLMLKRICQRKYEKTHSREQFMKLIGKNYLEDEK
jgi:hypothetical protein